MRHTNVILLAFTLFCTELTGLQAQSVTDADGNIYPITTIGKQVWMADNLKTTKYNDGKPIPLVTDDKKWELLKTPAYCWLNNDISNKEIYGGLYNWYTVNTKKLCPKGWHVPTDTEWGTMITFLGDENTAADKLKETTTNHWRSTINTATNDFDFAALPGGMRYETGVFPEFAHSYAVWWSASGSGTDAWNRGLFFSSSRTYKGHENMKIGFSVRCIKD